MSRLIDETRLACSLPALEGDELAAVVKLWGEVLHAAGVPFAELRRCLIQCLATRQGNYPVSVSEICEAWRAIKPPKQTYENFTGRGAAIIAAARKGKPDGNE